MTELYSLLLDTLLDLLGKGGFEIPDNMSQKGREEFIFHAIENSKIVPDDEYEALHAAAQFTVRVRDTHWLRAAVGLLAQVLAGGKAEVVPPVLILCQGGIVNEVVGLPEHAYEVCDTDSMHDVPASQAVRYFFGLSDAMKRHLRTTPWRSFLPEIIRNQPAEDQSDHPHQQHALSSWENEGGQSS